MLARGVRLYIVFYAAAHFRLGLENFDKDRTFTMTVMTIHSISHSRNKALYNAKLRADKDVIISPLWYIMTYFLK